MCVVGGSPAGIATCGVRDQGTSMEIMDNHLLLKKEVSQRVCPSPSFLGTFRYLESVWPKLSLSSYSCPLESSWARKVG